MPPSLAVFYEPGETLSRGVVTVIGDDGFRYEREIDLDQRMDVRQLAIELKDRGHPFDPKELDELAEDFRHGAYRSPSESTQSWSRDRETQECDSRNNEKRLARKETSSSLRGQPTSISQLGPSQPVDWIWQGFVAPGQVTLLAARWKAGKTTLLAHLIQEMAGGGDLGTTVAAGTVLIITEESEADWARRRDKLQIGDHVDVWARPFMTRPSFTDWLILVAKVATFVRERGYRVVIFDTLLRFLPIADENDAAQMTDALVPLHRVTEAGAALVLVHHLKKGDATEMQASRGSGALPAFVDTIVELRRYRPEDDTDRRRILKAVGRSDETEPELILELTEDGYISRGTRAQATQEDRLRILESIVPCDPPGATSEEMRAGWPNSGIPAPGLSALRSDLNAGLRLGDGKKGSPHRFHKRPGSPVVDGSGKAEAD
jgi:KaiC/GvpD/RAD55 family RecA-like ATPase